MKLRIVLAFIAVAVVTVVFLVYQLSATPQRASRSIVSLVTVVKVGDGDTVQLASGKEVRLLGIDAPEKGKPFYGDAKNRLRELVEGKEVSLESGTTNADQYGRLLRYIYVNDTFVNLLLVREGYAAAYIFSDNEKFRDELLAAEESAKKNELGLWKTSKFSRCIEIENFHYNAAGNDNDNLNDEYVVLKNICTDPIEITGWAVSDSGGNLFVFPKSALSIGDTVTLFSGSGNNTEANFYWKSDKPIWNNGGDTLFLRDAGGSLIISQKYGS